ncbi:MAG: hypothetical protein V2A34_05285, partial [Lentisphaerota bacterium]
MELGTISICFFFLFSFLSPVIADTHYVSPSGGSISPYTNWVDAATNIQDSIDVSSDGDLVLVADGVYAQGGRPAPGSSLTNRVTVDKAVTLRSLNGPATTFILGAPQPLTTNGPAAVRCVYLTTNSSLIGFTITNGHTTASSSSDLEQDGGGIFCASVSCAISHCTITGNSAHDDGAGCRYGTLRNCILTGNLAGNHGGGSSGSILYNCILTGNWAWSYGGGGTDNSTLYNCTLTENGSWKYGGGCLNGTLYNCI